MKYILIYRDGSFVFTVAISNTMKRDIELGECYVIGVDANVLWKPYLGNFANDSYIPVIGDGEMHRWN